VVCQTTESEFKGINNSYGRCDSRSYLVLKGLGVREPYPPGPYAQIEPWSFVFIEITHTVSSILPS
jgi:hypothetical protein